jgi:hypothetical protein
VLNLISDRQWNTVFSVPGIHHSLEAWVSHTSHRHVGIEQLIVSR